MDIERIRKYCLSLPRATEDVQWGDNLLFRVSRKIFAVIALDHTPTCMSFKCTPEEFAELTEREGIIPAPYMARNHWVMLERLDVLPPAELKQRVKNSYNLVAARLPKKARAELGLG